MKRVLSILLAIAVMMSALSLPVFAEDEESSGLWNSAKGLFGNAVSTVTEAATNAYDSAADALGDKTEYLGGKLNDLLANANGAFSSAKEWTKAFIDEQGKTVSATAGTAYENLGDWLSVTGDTSMDVLHVAFNSVAASMGIVGDSATELWNTIQYYAEINNITPATMVKLALSIMTMVVLSRTKLDNTSVGGAANDAASEYVEETLKLWLENFNITDQESADKALAEITESVDGYMDENTWVCQSCGSENHGQFCSGCGSERPKKADTWKCESCGETNHGRFCSNCGLPRPIERETWICDSCGETNIGNYCTGCGAPCPDVEDTWICSECGQESLGKFCSNCGSPRPE